MVALRHTWPNTWHSYEIELSIRDNDQICFLGAKTKTGVVFNSTQLEGSNYQLESFCDKLFMLTAMIIAFRFIWAKNQHDAWLSDFTNFGIRQQE